MAEPRDHQSQSRIYHYTDRKSSHIREPRNPSPWPVRIRLPRTNRKDVRRARICTDPCLQNPRTRLSTTRARRLTETGTMHQISLPTITRYLHAFETPAWPFADEISTQLTNLSIVSTSRRLTDILPSRAQTRNSEETISMRCTVP